MEQRNIRLMDIKDLMQYLSLGRDCARKFGQEAGAIFRYGNRVVYDRVKIDSYIEEIRDEETFNNGNRCSDWNDSDDSCSPEG